ncbi:hypothetical protein L9F63_003969, partial [Diploptera punctata]
NIKNDGKIEFLEKQLALRWNIHNEECFQSDFRESSLKPYFYPLNQFDLLQGANRAEGMLYCFENTWEK